jgi:tRNA A-37 threonylcarbamoyl transferase component Bud32
MCKTTKQRLVDTCMLHERRIRRTHDDLERIWAEMIAAYSKVLYQNSPEMTEEINEIPVPRYVTHPRYEQGSSLNKDMSVVA